MPEPEKTETPAADPAAPITPETPAPVALSYEDEVAAAVAAAVKGAPPVDETEDKPAGGEPAKDPAAPADGEPKPEPEKKPDEPAAEKPGSLPARLAMVAAGGRKNELRAQELDAREARLKPVTDLADRIQKAGGQPGGRLAIVRELLGGDEQIRDFYANELTDYISGEPGAPAKPAKPAEGAMTAEKLQELVAEGVRKTLDTMAQKQLEQDMASYATEALGMLEANPTKYPHTFSSPPTQRAITDISEELRKASKTPDRAPEVETVLEHIENHRKRRFTRGLPPQTTAAPNPAAAPGPNKTSAEKSPQPVRSNSVPVVQPAALSFDEEVARLAQQASSGA